MLKLLIIVALGAGGGALLGSTRSCETGGCPLTATPLRGAIYGAVMAGLVGLAVFGLPRGRGAASAAAALSPHLIAVSSSAQFEAEVLKAKGVVVVDFYADWCGPCRRLLPVISELADGWAGSVKVVKVNVDDAKDVAKAHGVSSIPDVRIFRDGQQEEQLVGGRDKAEYIAIVDRLRAAPAAGDSAAQP